MLGTLFYNIVEFLNYYITFKYLMNIKFTQKKLKYLIIIAFSFMVQIIVFYHIDNIHRDKLTVALGLLGALILTESKRWKVLFLYPLAVFIPSLINIVGSFLLAALLGITQLAVCESVWLTCLAECTAIILLLIYNKIRSHKEKDELQLSVGQYVLMILGAGGFFVIIAFSQVIDRNEWSIFYNNRNLFVYSCLLIAFCFFILSIWQQITWKKAYKYQMDNEKYEMFLLSQEKHIRLLITEDEKKRKLRHDMNAHMLAMNTLIENEQWEELQQYFSQIKDNLNEIQVQKYTSISAVDAIISEWHSKAAELQAIWVWEGTITQTDRITIFELCTVFSNLLSNAVEAIEKLQSVRKIHIKVTNFQDKLVLSIGNSCEQNIDTQFRPKTSKKDEINHGLGLRNVEDIVNKHGGSITYQGKSEWFQVEIIL